MLLIFSLAVFSQNTNSSIYSFFGIGEDNSPRTVDMHSMGGVGLAYADSYHFNLSNPASLASLQYVAYGLGAYNRATLLKSSSDKRKTSSFSLSHVSLALPLGKRGGLSLGIMPNSTVGYSSINNVYDTDGKIRSASLFKGEGGTNKIFGGIGYDIYKGIKVGVHTEYLFGNTTKTLTRQRAGDILATIYEDKSSIKGFLYTIGLQGEVRVNKKTKVKAGVTFRPETKVNDRRNQYLYSIANTVPGDTIYNVAAEVKRTIPAKLAVGVGIGQDNKWFAGIDYTMRAKYNFTLAATEKNTNVKYTNYTKISVGGFYTPKYYSVVNYWDRITYRAGFFYENTGLELGLNSQNADLEGINNYGIAFGVGLPTGNRLSSINLGVELGKKGTTSNGLIQESYATFRVGISLNDKWFKKRKIF